MAEYSSMLIVHQGMVTVNHRVAILVISSSLTQDKDKRSQEGHPSLVVISTDYQVMYMARVPVLPERCNVMNACLGCCGGRKIMFTTGGRCVLPAYCTKTGLGGGGGGGLSL